MPHIEKDILSMYEKVNELEMKTARCVRVLDNKINFTRWLVLFCMLFNVITLFLA